MCEKERVIFLVGIGMGTGDGMTVQAEKCIRSCDCLIGAQRMLESVGSEVRKTKPMLAEYRPTEIVSYAEGTRSTEGSECSFPETRDFTAGQRNLLQKSGNGWRNAEWN